MEEIIPRFTSKLSKMWIKVTNLENRLFSQLQQQLGTLSAKEQKLIKILDFAEIENYVRTTSSTNPPKDREQIARAFIAKSVYNFQTTRDLIDRTLRILCGWRYSTLKQQKDMQTADEMLSLVSTECGVGVKQNSKSNR